MNRDRNSQLVLVVDDEVNTTIMLQHIFEREGYSVERVSNGFEALEAARDHQPDLILLDILMPGMNGFEVLQRLRQDPLTDKIPTIMVTANAREPSDVARGLTLGADDYLYKPFAPQELLARAQSKIRARQLEDALKRRTEELEALLQVSEKLNQHLEMADLLDLILELVLDLLPGDLAVVHELDENGEVVDYRMISRNSVEVSGKFPDQALVAACLRSQGLLTWPGDGSYQVDGFSGGMALTLQHGDRAVGVLLIAQRNAQYDDRHQRLFVGIARQAALALMKAQLFEIQANYAVHLEDMVAERTSELESAQRMLIRSEKLASIGHLAASIAHEINNPLMPISNLLEDLIDELEQRRIEVDLRAVSIIQESLERIRRIVSRLLEFARDTDADIKPLDITDILDGIIRLNQRFFEHERVTIRTEFTPLPLVHGSKDQLEQVFMNLALNAQAAMDGGGTLTIRAYGQADDVVVEFEDTGCGIPPQQIDKIFDPFFSTKPSGTGLGLFVSYGIIQGHHGTIEVKSKVGAGTKFTVRLPLIHMN